MEIEVEHNGDVESKGENVLSIQRVVTSVIKIDTPTQIHYILMFPIRIF